jgi:hypothetical protein
MGCDIHGHIEIKLNGNWEHYSVLCIDRNYKLFEKMAGVRGLVKRAISPPKGLPNDITPITKYDFEMWGEDAHTPSWLGAKEIERLIDWGEENYLSSKRDFEYETFGYLFGNSFMILKYPRDTPKGLTDVRFVFWFDN